MMFGKEKPQQPPLPFSLQHNRSQENKGFKVLMRPGKYTMGRPIGRNFQVGLSFHDCGLYLEQRTESSVTDAREFLGSDWLIEDGT